MEDNNKTAHWVVHSKLKPLDTEDFSKEKVIDDIQDSLTGTTIKHSASGRKYNPDFLQESEEQGAEEENADADVTAEANKINGDDKDMIILIEEEYKNLEYQETMKVYVENIPKKNNIWRPIY